MEGDKGEPGEGAKIDFRAASPQSIQAQPLSNRTGSNPSLPQKIVDIDG